MSSLTRLQASRRARQKRQAHRGSFFDLPALTIIIVVLVVGVITLMFSAGQINTSLPASTTQYATAYGQNPVQAVVDMTGLLDGLIVFVFIASGLASVALARQAPPQNAVFWWGGILLLICMGLVWPPITNALITFMGSSQIASTANSFTYTTVLVSHLPVYFYILAALLAIATWGKTNQSAGGYYG